MNAITMEQMIDSLEWRIIPQNPEYLVSEQGFVRKKGSYKLLQIRIDEAGRKWVVMRKGRNPDRQPLDRLICGAFVRPPLPYGASIIKYVDGNSQNIDPSNLQWEDKPHLTRT